MPVSWLFPREYILDDEPCHLLRSITIYLTLPTILCTAISMRSINTVVIHTINFKDWTCSFCGQYFLTPISYLVIVSLNYPQFYYYVLIPHSTAKLFLHEKQFSGNIIMTGNVMPHYIAQIYYSFPNINFTFFY